MNKVKYNLKNVHYASVTLDDNRVPTFDKVVRWPGAVSLTMDPQGDTTPFYADGITFYVSVANNGYSGSLEMALIPDSFRKDILGDILDENGVLIEDVDAKAKNFALLFEFDGDEKAIRHVLYNCVAARPSVSSQTVEGSITPVTDTLNLTASTVYNPDLKKNIVKAKSGSETNAASYDAWYEEVYMSKGSTPTLGTLNITSTAGSNTGDTIITVSEALSDPTNKYKYKVENAAVPVEYGQNVQNWNLWDGTSEITANTGEVLTLVESDSEYKAIKAGSVTVTSAD